MNTFEAIGSQIAYRFGLLPKWTRACFWALGLTAALIAFVVIAIAIVIWVVTTFGGLAVFSAICIGIVFAVVLTTVWDDIPGDKRKNGE